MTRPYCPSCEYPQQTCICHAISKSCFQTQLIVLQHPGETAHAKNTARLIKLVVPDTELVVGETEEDFAELRERLGGDPHAVLLFPDACSKPLEESAKSQPISTLLIIDGTWRKAKKIWLSNPWLQRLRVCHLDAAQDSAYSIRRGSQPGGMASIEAAACALEQLEAVSTEPLMKAFMAMQANWPSR